PAVLEGSRIFQPRRTKWLRPLRLGSLAAPPQERVVQEHADLAPKRRRRFLARQPHVLLLDRASALPERSSHAQGAVDSHHVWGGGHFEYVGFPKAKETANTEIGSPGKH
ncbi:hypothetical protein NGA_2049600, partial [Nannochloropsis gaditana CCMP526]|uniref:uncharacterized protein n=1 Tax=Nannochloropsis gaditana (strain CCMP526) TaxID=1093141 RepID=UPI00029F7C92